MNNNRIEKTGVEVQRTTNYGMFVVMDGNRDVGEDRVRTIKNSIIKHGYIHNPIVVNEKYEVVDGQGRLAALKELGIPVEFVIFRGLTVKECRVLNTYQERWTVVDYISSYANDNDSYNYLLEAINKYRELTVRVCLHAFMGYSCGDKYELVKSGFFECTAEEARRANELLAYAMRFVKKIKTFKKGPLHYITIALMFVYQLKECDKEKMVVQFEKYYGMDKITPFYDTQGAFNVLSQVYNYNCNVKDRLYFFNIYEQKLAQKYEWYARRLSER